MSIKIDKGNFRFALILALIAVCCFLIIMLFGSDLLPPTSKPTTEPTAQQKQPQTDEFNITELSRYAFITDQKSPQLAILDLYDKQIVKTIELKTTPQLTAISREADYIWYAQRNSKQLYRLDLSTLEQTAFQLSQNLQQLIVSANGQWIAYQAEQNVIALNTEQSAETILPTTGESTLIFIPNKETLLIGERQTGRVAMFELTNQTTKELFTRQQPISEISIMPNLMAFFFTSENRLFHYSLLNEQLTEHDFTVANKRPYITSESRKLLLFGKNENSLQVINAYTLKLIHSFPLNPVASIENQILTGWLEQVVTIAGQNTLQSIDLNAEQSPKNTALNAPIVDMAVQADSKKLLITTQNSNAIIGFDMRQQKITNQIPTELKQPNQIIMGQTNRLCH